MEGLPNRKQRREWAKQTGMLKKKQKSSLKEQMEMTERAIETGNQIHLANTERILREDEKIKNESIAKKTHALMEKGLSQEDALKILEEISE